MLNEIATGFLFCLSLDILASSDIIDFQDTKFTTSLIIVLIIAFIIAIKTIVKE